MNITGGNYMSRAVVGGYGAVVATTIATTPEAGHRFIAIQALGDLTINAATSGNVTNLAGNVLASGQIIYGIFTSVTLSTAGSRAICYHGM